MIEKNFNIEAEQAVLGACLLSSEAFWKIADLVQPDHFFKAQHRVIWEAISELAHKGSPFDCITLAERFEANGTQNEAGGTDYVVRLSSSTPSAANVRSYADIVRDKWLSRVVRDAGARIAALDGDGEAIAAEAQRIVMALSANSQKSGLHHVKKAAREWSKQLNDRYIANKRITGLPMPFHALNEATKGLQPGNLIILAGRPAMGKTAVALEIAAFTALRGDAVAIFEQEMTCDELVQRCVSNLGEVPHDHLMIPSEIKEEKWARITNAVTSLVESKLFIDDSPGLTHEQICARVRRQHAIIPLSLVVIDHLQLMAIPSKIKNRTEGIGAITKALKGLAKELKIPILLLSQLNRGVESRVEKRPMMSDLRDSGDIEQDADIVAFLYRDEYYNTETHLVGTVELILSKVRNGKSGQTIWLQNRLDIMRLEDWAGTIPKREKPIEQHAQKERGFKSKVSHIGNYA